MQRHRTQRLSLEQQTIRILAGAELERVAGASSVDAVCEPLRRPVDFPDGRPQAWPPGLE